MDDLGRFDAIVIGSGMGGVTVAALLAHLRGWRVAVLERQPELGGFTHGFSRVVEGRRYRWDPDLHYVGGMAPGAPTRKVMDLVTGGVDWVPLADPMERFVFPDLTLEVPAGVKAFRETLHEAFPRARATIDRCFRHLSRAAAWLGAHLARRGLPPPASWVAHGLDAFDEGFANRSVEAWLEAEVADPRLKGVLGARWGDSRLPPEHASLAMHAAVWMHFRHGAFAPRGGSSVLVEGARRRIEGASGVVFTQASVARVRVEGGVAVGVEGRCQGRRVRADAPVVISDAGAAVTFGRLIDDSEAERGRIEALRPIPSAVIGFLGLSDAARSLDGWTGIPVWLYRQWSHAALWRQRARVFEGEPQSILLTGNLSAEHAPTAQVVSIVDADTFGGVLDEAVVTEGLLAAAERAQPGLRSCVEHVALAGPGGGERFGGQPQGAIYGLPVVPARFRGPPFGPETRVPGLFLTGADACTPGLLGAMMGGVLAAAACGGPSITEVFGGRPRAVEG